MKRLLTLSTLLLLSIMNFAQTEVDGIYYEFAGTEAIVVSGANKYTGDVIIPASVTNGNQNYSVTRIYQKAFYGCTGLTSVTIPNSVTIIGASAFEGCTGLETVTDNSSISIIEDRTFYGCSGLTSINIPSNVTSIGGSAFSGCSGLTSINIPSNVTSIGQSAFGGCTGLTSIKVQEGNTKYDSRNNCNAIIETASNTLIRGCKNTVIPNSVTSIGNSAFSGCSGLTSITIPNSVTSIGERAFQSCSGLTSITIPNSVTSIGDYAFQKCSGLTSITIPNSVTSIGERAFQSCSGLTSITIPNSVTSIGEWAFSNCSGLTSITIPNSVTSIGNYAFDDCSGLTSITIPNSVTSIGYRVFQRCSGLTSITIPNSVTSIENYAFSGCSGLVSIYSYIENPTSAPGSNFDSSNYTNATLYVLKGKKNEYLATDGWKNFVKITEFAPTYTLTYKVDDETYKTYQVEYGTTIVPEPAPTKDGYTFSGWSEIPATMPAHNVEVYGKFYNPEDIESAWVDASLGGTDAAVPVTAGTVVASSASIEMFQAFDDSFKAVSMTGEAHVANQITIDGVTYPVNEYKDLQAQTNPTPNSLGTATDGAWIGGQNTGAVFGFNVKKDGLLCVFGSFTATKQYYAWEGDVVNSLASLAAYRLVGMGTAAVEGTVPTCDYILPAADGSNLADADAMTANPDKWLKSSNEIAAANVIDPNFFSGNALGVIIVPVYAGQTYYVNACRSKITSNGFAFIPKMAPTTADAANISVTFSKALPTYNLTYKVDGEIYKQYKLAEGDAITPELAPTRDGYTFSGWSEIPATMPASDVTVTGTFTINKYNLTYKVDGVTYKQYEVAEGDAITPEPAPTKEGYSFSGWSEIPATMPANDVTIIGTFAQNPTETESAFVDVSALGIDDQELHEISAGTTLCESSSVSMSNAYDDSFSAVSMAISEEQNYQVNINGKKYIYGEGVRGATNAKPYSIGECQEDGTFVGGQYEGWVYKFTTLYDGYLYVPCRIATNKSIYVWAGNADEAAGRLVAYNYRGITSDGQLASVSLPSNSDDYYVGPNDEYDTGTTMMSIQSIDKNLILEESSLWTNGVIAFPVKASVGTYYVCATGTKLHSNGFVFVPGAKDIGEVVFSPRTFTLTYQVDGETYRTYELAEGDVITPEAAPTKEGYTFSGWSEIPETMPANDVTVIGTFTAIPEPSSDNALAISNAETYTGKQIVLPIDMNNVASIKAFQFDLYLPDGVTIAKDEDEEELIELTSRAAKSHTIAYSNRPDGAIRMVCTSMSGATFKGNEGAIVNVTLDVAQSMTDGDYDIEVKNIELSDGTPYNPADIKATLTVKTYTPGDVDGTGTVSVNDAVCVINYILGSPAEDFIEPAADLDGNGVITVNDVVILINDYILGGNSQNSFDLAFLQDVTADDDYLYIEEDNLSNMTVGEEREIEVFMNTSRTDIQGLQCDIYLPEGMEFVPEEDGDEKYYADKGGRAAKSHSVAAQLMADGSVRVVETSTSGAKFKANELAVFYFTVRATANTAYGQGIRLCNMELSYGGAPINPEDRTFDVKVKAGTVSLNSEGYATFSHASDVEVEGAEVYTATRNGNIISCTKEEQSVAAFNGVILKGEPNATVTLYTNNGVEGYTGNELKPTTTAAGVADIETALVLSGNMFKNYTGAAFDADKAYMPYDGNSANAIGIVFNGATAIDGIASENNLLDGAVIKTVEDGKLVIKTANGKYSSVGAKMK